MRPSPLDLLPIFSYATALCYGHETSTDADGRFVVRPAVPGWLTVKRGSPFQSGDHVPDLSGDLREAR